MAVRRERDIAEEGRRRAEQEHLERLEEAEARAVTAESVQREIARVDEARAEVQRREAAYRDAMDAEVHRGIPKPGQTNKRQPRQPGQRGKG